MKTISFVILFFLCINLTLAIQFEKQEVNEVNAFFELEKSLFELNEAKFGETIPLDKFNCNKETFSKKEYFNGNKKEITKYQDNPAFVVSATNWKNVLKATTLAIWNNDGNDCSTYSESENSLCAYPLIILHEEEIKDELLQDYMSPTILLQQASIKKIITYNTKLSQKTKRSFQQHLKTNESIEEIGTMDYLGFWEEKGYQTVIISEDDYETGIHATIFASALNAPIIFASELDKKIIKILQHKKIIAVGDGVDNFIMNALRQKYRIKYLKKELFTVNQWIDILSPKIFRCHQYSRSPEKINEKIPYYMSMKRKIILYDPNDIDESKSTDGRIFINPQDPKKDASLRLTSDNHTTVVKKYEEWFAPFKFEHVFYQDSLIVPYLAIARNEYLLSVSQQLNLHSIQSETKTYKEPFAFKQPLFNMASCFQLTTILSNSEKLFSISSKKYDSLKNYEKQFCYQFTILKNIRTKLQENSFSNKQDVINYYTLVGSPNVFPFSPFSNHLKDRWTFPTDYYTITNNSNQDYLARGKIMGFTISDTSSLVMRNLFFKSKSRKELEMNYLSHSDSLIDQKNFAMTFSLLKKYFPQSTCTLPSTDFTSILSLGCQASPEAYLKVNLQKDINFVGTHGAPDGTEFCWLKNPSCLRSGKNPRIDIFNSCLTLNLFDWNMYSAGIGTIRYGAKAYFGYEGSAYADDWNRYLPQILLANYGENLFLGDFSSLLLRNRIALVPVSGDYYFTQQKIFFPINKRNQYNNFNKLILIGDPLTTLIPQEENNFHAKKLNIYYQPIHTIIHTQIEPFNYSTFYKKIAQTEYSLKGEKTPYFYKDNTFFKKTITFQDSIFEFEQSFFQGFVFKSMYYYPFVQKTNITITTLVVSPYVPYIQAHIKSVTGMENKTDAKQCSLTNNFFYSSFAPKEMNAYICTDKITSPKAIHNKELTVLIVNITNKDGSINLYDRKNILLFKNPYLESDIIDMSLFEEKPIDTGFGEVE